ncbi:MAG: pimeloyl-CoA dehydrogenase small subunit [Alphaproteobacteria bacterium]|nr:pimeloyl-CoA dehydrogenase small subunit [Alphaproteobacteria bacterium]
MDLELTTEQQILKDAADRFAREDYTLEKRRKLVDSDLGWDEGNWKTFAEQGWLAVGMPEDAGGIGGAVETMIIMEAVGRGLIVEPYLWTVVVCGGLIRDAGSAAQKAEILPRIVEGKMKLAFAFAERQARYDLADVVTAAKEADGGFVIDGAKGVVFGGNAADRLIVVARTSGKQRAKAGLSLFLVDPKAQGVSIRPYRNVDGTKAAEVSFKGVKVPASALIGDKDKALPLIEAAADQAIAALASEAVGCMQVLHDQTLHYIKTRKQFGVHIGHFQAIQHRMADMFIALEHSRSMAIYATLNIGERSAAKRKKAISAAKVAIGQNGRLVGQETIQLHGGMGMTDELAVGHYFKRLTMIDRTFGDVDFHMDRFAAL